MRHYIGSTTEIYVGEDAWQVWTEFDQRSFMNIVVIKLIASIAR